jgi:hypothetical protein
LVNCFTDTRQCFKNGTIFGAATDEVFAMVPLQGRNKAFSKELKIGTTLALNKRRERFKAINPALKSISKPVGGAGGRK